MRKPSIDLDHLVVAADNLADGARYLEDKFGVAPDGGGRHDGWGTHNLLISVGSGTYLELIAPDPQQAAPKQPRAFGMDNRQLRERIAVRPRLVHFLTRTNDIGQASQSLGYALPEAKKMSRGDLSWQLSLNEFPDSAGVQLLPSMINWADQRSPGESLPARGVALTALHLRGPADLCDKLRPLLSDRRINIAERSSAMITAEFQTPNGWAILD